MFLPAVCSYLSWGLVMGYTGLKGLPPTPNPGEAVQRNAMELLLSPSGTVGKTAEAGGQVPHCRFTKLSAKEDPTVVALLCPFLHSLPTHPNILSLQLWDFWDTRWWPQAGKEQMNWDARSQAQGRSQ